MNMRRSRKFDRRILDALENSTKITPGAEEALKRLEMRWKKRKGL